MPGSSSNPTTGALTQIQSQLRRPPGHVRTPSRTHLRVRMYEVLHPGSSALATILDWDGNAYTANTVVERLTVSDPLHRVFALKNEDIDIVWREIEERWEVDCTFGLQRKGKLAGELEQADHQFVDIWSKTAAVDPAVQVLVEDWLMNVGDDPIAAGVKVEMYYDQGDQAWFLEEAQCTPDP